MKIVQKAFMRLVAWVATIPLFVMFALAWDPRVGDTEVSIILHNAALLLSWGFLHSLMARNVWKKWLEKRIGEGTERLLYVLIQSLLFAGVLLLWKPVGGFIWRTEGWFFAVLSAANIFLIIAMVRTFNQIDAKQFLGITAWLNRKRKHKSRPPEFTASGFYAYCRHPMYTLLIASFWVAPLMTLGRLEFVALATIYILTAAHLEEKNLREELGPVYDDYRKNVPMWLPRLSPWYPSSDEAGS